MSDALPWIATLLLSGPLVALAVFDVQVARELGEADQIKPSIPFLSLVKGIVYGVTAAASLSAMLGIASAASLIVGVRLLPPPTGLVALYLICVIASIMVYRLRSWIRSQR